MKLSTRGRYGLRALIDLAVHETDGAVSAQSIAQRQNISESYLEQLIRKLKQDGLVDSVRGAGGGYRLAKPAEEISVGSEKDQGTTFTFTIHVYQKPAE